MRRLGRAAAAWWAASLLFDVSAGRWRDPAVLEAAFAVPCLGGCGAPRPRRAGRAPLTRRPASLFSELPKELVDAAEEPLDWEAMGSRLKKEVESDLRLLPGQEDPAYVGTKGAARPLGRGRSNWPELLEETTSLLGEVGLDRAALRETVLPAVPQLARLEPETVLASFRCLAEAFGGDAAAAAIVLKQPTLLSYEAEAHLEKAFTFLATMSAVDEQQAKVMAAASPELYVWAVKGVLRELQSYQTAKTSAAATAGMLRAATSLRGLADGL